MTNSIISRSPNRECVVCAIFTLMPRYLWFWLSTFDQIWMSSSIFVRTFSWVVFWISCWYDSQLTLLLISSWIGAPQFFTTDSSTISA